MKQYLYYSLAVLLLGSCASKPAIDYDPAADFTAYGTYAWSAQTDDFTKKSQADAPLLHQRVRESINAAVQSKGFQLVDASAADVLVSYHLAMQITGYSGSSVSFGIGGFSSRSAVGLSVGMPIGGQVIEEGTLAIIITDVKKNAVVWQGSGARRLSPSTTPEQAKAVVDEVVSEILAGYPPKK
ncbi:MAG TPA: DUF4136 domain-containing protein [Gammaproteobacteria bacterium]